MQFNDGMKMIGHSQNQPDAGFCDLAMARMNHSQRNFTRKSSHELGVIFENAWQAHVLAKGA
jgi:hypothetical protein